MWISNNYLLKLRFLITLFLCMLFTAGITHAASPREKLSSKIIQNSGIVSTAVTLKPDLVVTRVTMSKDCRIQFTLKNTSKGGLADKFHRQGSVKIRVTGKTSKNYIIPFRIVDTRGLLKKAGGSVTYVSAINISKTAYVKVDVDPGNKIPELNETNNSRRIQLRPKCSTTKNKPQSRVYLKPDLVVTKVTMSKDCRIQFTLKNTSKGRLADKFHRQGSVKIRVSGKDPKNHLIPFRIVDTKGLLKKAGGSVPYVSAINIPKTAYVKIDVDPGNKIPELNETNNSRRIQLRPKCSTAENKPQSREYLKPDLIIDSFINATENPTVTDDNVITVSVRNQGPASSTASKLELKVGGEATPPKYDVPALASGATHTLRRHINLPIALTYLSIAKIDADNGNVESDETNNEAELIFAVSPPPRPDLIIDSFINATENPTVTDDNVITVSVRNQGPASSTASKLELKVGGEATPPKYDVPALASGATHTLRRHINLPNALRYLSIAKIDSDNGNVESDETNNEAELIFAVSPPPRPDLIIDSFINATENPTVTDDNVITVSVRNQGPASSTASKLELKVGGEAAPPKYDVPALASGATHTLRRHINLPNALRYLSIAKIDADNGNVESDETNNEAELIFAVSPPPRPDLIIDSFINATENPTVADDNVITVSVRNQGPASSTASKLELKVGGEAAPPKYDIPALASGATYTLRRHINLPNALRYLSIAKIDADNGNVESDETNNEEQLIFTVSPPLRIRGVRHK